MIRLWRRRARHDKWLWRPALQMKSGIRNKNKSHVFFLDWITDRLGFYDNRVDHFHLSSNRIHRKRLVLSSSFPQGTSHLSSNNCLCTESDYTMRSALKRVQSMLQQNNQSSLYNTLTEAKVFLSLGDPL